MLNPSSPSRSMTSRAVAIASAGLINGSFGRGIGQILPFRPLVHASAPTGARTVAIWRVAVLSAMCISLPVSNALLVDFPYPDRLKLPLEP